MDKEGTCEGFDLDLIFEVSKNTSVPIIASGGFGNLDDLELADKAGADAIAVAHKIHYKKLSLRQIRSFALEKISVRNFAQ